MAQTSKTRKQQHTTAGEHPVEEMADKARKNYEQTVRMGQKLQEEAGQWWTKMLSQTSTAADWQKQFTHLSTMATGLAPMAQRPMQAAIDLVEQTGRTNTELLKKAVDAAQCSSLAESQAKWLEFWTSSIKATQSNVQAVSELNTRAIDSWIEFVRKNSRTAEFRVPSAA